MRVAVRDANISFPKWRFESTERKNKMTNRTITTRIFGTIAAIALAISANAQDTGPVTDAPGVTPPSPPEITIPDAPDVVSDELREKMAAYRAEQHELRTALREVVGALEDPTRDEIGVAREAFREANADRIAAQRELEAEIREELGQIRGKLRGHRFGRRGRPLPPGADEIRTVFHEKRAEIHAVREDLRTLLSDASEEEREALIEQFREEQRARHEELKDFRRSVRDSVRGDREDTAAGDEG